MRNDYVNIPFIIWLQAPKASSDTLVAISNDGLCSEAALLNGGASWCVQCCCLYRDAFTCRYSVRYSQGKVCKILLCFVEIFQVDS